MLFKKKKDLRYEVLNGSNEVVFTGYAPECLEFYETDKNRCFFVRGIGEKNMIKADVFFTLAALVAKTIKKKECQGKQERAPDLPSDIE